MFAILVSPAIESASSREPFLLGELPDASSLLFLDFADPCLFGARHRITFLGSTQGQEARHSAQRPSRQEEGHRRREGNLRRHGRACSFLPARHSGVKLITTLSIQPFRIRLSASFLSLPLSLSSSSLSDSQGRRAMVGGRRRCLSPFALHLPRYNRKADILPQLYSLFTGSP